MAKLKKMLTHPRKNESGQGVLAIVLILLMLGAIILTPLLVFMNTGLKAGGVYESKMQEFYAADAGVEDAIWNITYANLTTPANYTLADEVNNRTTNVTIVPISGGGYSGYKIISNATSDSGGNTTIECNYGALDYSSLLDNAITSNGTVDLKNKVNVTGNVSTPNCKDAGYSFICNKCPGCNYTIDSLNCDNCTKCCSQEPVNWPTAEQLSAYYWDAVKNLEPPFPYNDPLNIAGTNTTIEALYRNGPWKIYNTGNPATLTLNGTVYVTGDLEIGNEKKDFTLNLNNQTIFVKSNSTGDGKEAIKVGGNVKITGSGCIIAVGDIAFYPNIESGSKNDFVFLLSVKGTIRLRPGITFYGAVAGNVEVAVQQGEKPSITWTGLNNTGVLVFPTGKANMKVLSYTIK